MLREKVLEDGARDFGRDVIGPSTYDILEFNSHIGELTVRPERFDLNPRDLVVPTLSASAIVFLAGCTAPGAEKPSPTGQTGKATPSPTSQIRVNTPTPTNETGAGGADSTGGGVEVFVTPDEIKRLFNGFRSLVKSKGNHIEVTDGGHMYQCVDLVEGWAQYLGAPLETVLQPESAYQIYENANDQTRHWFDVIKYKPGMIFLTGDIVIFDKDFPGGGGNGHTGVASGKGSATQAEIFAQNTKGDPINGGPAVLQTYKIGKGSHVEGILRPKLIDSDVTIPDQTPTKKPTATNAPTPAEAPVPTLSPKELANMTWYMQFSPEPAPFFFPVPKGWETSEVKINDLAGSGMEYGVHTDNNSVLFVMAQASNGQTVDDFFAEKRQTIINNKPDDNITKEYGISHGVSLPNGMKNAIRWEIDDQSFAGYTAHMVAYYIAGRDFQDKVDVNYVIGYITKLKNWQPRISQLLEEFTARINKP
jgi:hypothetical protein